MKNEGKINITFWGNCCLLVCLLWLSACSTTKYLVANQSFVKKNTVQLIHKESVQNSKKLESDLLNIVIQKPNTKFFGLDRRWFYYQKKKQGKIAEKKFAGKRTIYEIPSIYDSLLAIGTTDAMKYYLKEKGYFLPTVTYKATTENRQTSISYFVDPGRLFVIDSATFISTDIGIQKALNTIKDASLLKKGTPISIKLYEDEKNRITQYLRNNGYREFYTNYIDQLETKTDTATSTQLAVQLSVFPRTDETPHQIYTTDKIAVYPYYTPAIEKSLLEDTLVDGMHFFYLKGEKFPIKPEVISKRIFLEEGQLYSQENFNKTARNLGDLGVFKFANIEDRIHQDSSYKIDFNIYLPANKKIVLGADVEINNTFFSETPIASGNFLGGALNFSYRNRNLFRGSENLEFNFGIGGEFGGENGNKIFRTFDIDPKIDLNIPKFSDPLGVVKFLNSVGLFSDAFYKSLLENATTRVSFGLNWSQRRDFWGFFSGDLSLGYNIQNNPNRRYFVNQFGIHLFNPNIGSRGEPIFLNNPFLERSFNNKQLFTGLLFKDFGLVFTNRNPSNKDSWRLNLNLELSGVEVFLANTIYNEFKSVKSTFKLFDLDYSQFARLEIDAIYYKYLSNQRTLAFRLNTAIATSYGFSEDVPYVKQFIAGGPSSVRAWKIRELGPGGYQDPSTFPAYSPNSIPFYQAGDIKFIFSTEYRFKMFKLYALDLEGALFLDGGNVWTLKADPSRPNSEFTSRFWNQIALGTGVGFRMDFEYFKLTLDLGYRVRNPYPNSEGSYWAYQRWRELKLKGINYNLAVGYPF